MITTFASRHYGKLWVLGMGLLFLGDLFELAYGIPPAKDALFATSVYGALLVLGLSAAGCFLNQDSERNT